MAEGYRQLGENCIAAMERIKRNDVETFRGANTPYRAHINGHILSSGVWPQRQSI